MQLFTEPLVVEQIVYSHLKDQVTVVSLLKSLHTLVLLLLEPIKVDKECGLEHQEINKTTQKQNDSQNKDIIHKNIQKKIKKNPKIIKNSIVIIISIIATILLIDTFKFQLNNYIPGIDSILNNLYESLKDLSLFFKDLIN